jgi:hypothetical protein
MNVASNRPVLSSSFIIGGESTANADFRTTSSLSG